MVEINIPSHKKVYFASDFHFGAPDYESSLVREKKVVRWLDSIQDDAGAILLMGDMFDFWFEYKHVVPKGFVRFLGKVAEIADKGVPIWFFLGNHDMWMFDYFPKELGVKMISDPTVFKINNKIFYLGHGDALGPGDFFFKLVRVFFRSKACQWFFSRIHPNGALGFAHYWSAVSRKNHNHNDNEFLGEENEWLFIHSSEVEAKKHHDYYIFGHRHLPMNLKVSETSNYINLGEWINFCTYLTFDGTNVEMHEFEKDKN